MASGSPDSGERERGGDGERERELAKTSRSPDSSECERGGDGEREKESAMTSSSSGMTPDYWNASYWDERYRNNYSSYDWYMEYPSLVSLFDLYLRRHHRILIIGCGNSGHSDGQLGFVCCKYAQEPLILAVNYPALGEDLVDDGYQDVVNIDISSVLIETMQAKYSHKSIKFLYDACCFLITSTDIKMDVRDMSPFESGSFDAVIDKGTLDTFMCGEDDITHATQLLKEVERVLKDKGAYILITFDSPNNRLDLLRSVELWNIKLHLLERAAKSSRRKRWELSAPRPLDRDGSWATEALGSHLDVFYTYVCIKVNGLARIDESLSANQATDSEIPSSQNDP
ncbi:hypothetical protein ZIOFF_014482 [Zingiber officinale]|uniref:Methyltransferase type 11 domain-containing protein n=1 Tax=Zingiber officinale TaxID=94328 RepID=A0A8J5HWD4_ZINOF|nr:hypothetical protein ZIOFF_014482 [Zingiber officinale]